jgi:hypothetical protein
MINRLKKQCIIALATELSLWTIACTHRPLYHHEKAERDIVADIIAQDEYNRQQTTVKIVDRGVALNLLNEGK